MADEAGDEGQRAGPQVLDHGGHEGSGQGLLKGAAGRRVLGLVAVGDDHAGNPLLSEAAEETSGHMITWHQALTPLLPGRNQ